jgi:hypothetical protein
MLQGHRGTAGQSELLIPNTFVFGDIDEQLFYAGKLPANGNLVNVRFVNAKNVEAVPATIDTMISLLKTKAASIDAAQDGSVDLERIILAGAMKLEISFAETLSEMLRQPAYRKAPPVELLQAFCDRLDMDINEGNVIFLSRDVTTPRGP